MQDVRPIEQLVLNQTWEETERVIRQASAGLDAVKGIVLQGYADGLRLVRGPEGQWAVEPKE